MSHVAAIYVARAYEDVPSTPWIFLYPREYLFGSISLPGFNFTLTEVCHLIVVVGADLDVAAAVL